MNKKLLLSFVLFFTFLINYGQCSVYPTAFTTSQAGVDQIFCIDGTNPLTVGLDAQQYVVLNVIKGYTYSFAVNNVWTSGGATNREYLGVYNNATNAKLTENYNQSGCTINNWTSTLSGQVKVLLLRGDICSSTGSTTTGTLTMTLNSIGNTFDSQTAEGTDRWRGHIYNYAGGGSPGGLPSPTALTADVNPFFNADYAGYYNVNPVSETINENFTGNYACFSVLSDGTKRAEIYTESFAVRYRMNSKRPAGCYLATFTGDDGVRLYVDGVNVFDEWKEQSSLTYNSVLIYLTGDSHLVFDYYENGGGNQVNFSLTPLNATSNTVTPATTTICGGLTGTLNGSNYPYNGGTVNPTIKFQWQFSSSASGPWTDATTGTGFDAEDYTPAAITQSTVNTTYYRRRVSPVSTAACYSDSTPVSITTNPKAVIPNMTLTSCSASAFSVTPVDGINGVVPAGTTYTWLIPTTTGGAGAVTGRVASSGSQTSISGALTNTTTIPQNVTYTVTATKGSCSSNFTLIVTVYPTTIAGTVSGNSSVCAGTNSTVLTLNGSRGSVLRWESSTDNFASVITPIANTTTTLTATDISAITYYRAVVQSGNCSVVNSSVGTVTTKNPIATGVTICQKGSDSLTASATCGSVTQVATASGTGGVSNSTSYGNAANTNITINFPTLPVGAVVTGTNVTISFYTNGNSYRNELLVKVTPPSSAGVVLDDVRPSSLGSAGPVDKAALGSWGTGNPAGNWTFAFKESYDDLVNPDANISNITITVNYTLSGTLDWFTTASGGTKIGSGSPFNPVGVLNSGLDDTDTVRTVPYYVACSSDTTCRTRVDFVINPSPTPPVVGTVTQPTCVITSGSIPLSGLPVDGTLTRSPGAVIVAYTGTAVTDNNLGAGTYTYTVGNGTCTSAATSNVVVNAAPLVATYNAAGSWSSPPTIDKKLVFEGNYPPAVDPNVDISGCSCQVNSGATVLIKTGRTLTITNDVKVAGGTLRFENGASLIQTNNVPNSGSIIYERTAAPMKAFDFTYWSSPVNGQLLNVLSPNTLADKYLSYSSGWISEAGTNAMTLGKGYIIRVPKIGPWPNGEIVSYPYAQPVKFIGVPNNGHVIGETVVTGKSYLIGNPYPSALDADKFLLANKTILSGTIYFWTHNTGIAQNGSVYRYSPNDYASYNGVGGTNTKPAGSAKDPNDYPSGKIAAGQSFFGVAVGNGTIDFTNAMRTTGSNSQFFKPSKTNKAGADSNEKSRVWLNLSNIDGLFKQALIGYVAGATNDYDNLFDGITLNGNTYVDFYSVNNTSKFVIQGRALPFEQTDIVPLGYKSTIAGDFTIAIDQADGALANQAIYLEDKATGTVNDLTQKGYTFKTAVGTFNDRFVLRYTNKTLGTGEFEAGENAVLVSVDNKAIKINTFSETIDKVFVYDVSGKLIYKKEKVGNPILVIDPEASGLKSSNQVLLVKVVLDNKHTETKKVIF